MWIAIKNSGQKNICGIKLETKCFGENTENHNWESLIEEEMFCSVCLHESVYTVFVQLWYSLVVVGHWSIPCPGKPLNYYMQSSLWADHHGANSPHEVLFPLED